MTRKIRGGAQVLRIVCPRTFVLERYYLRTQLKGKRNMSTAVLAACQALRSDVFVEGFAPEWLQIDGTQIQLQLPFAAKQAAEELIQQFKQEAPQFAHYDWTITVASRGTTCESSNRAGGLQCTAS